MKALRAVCMIAWTVLIEAVRRRDVYVLVGLCCLLIAGVMTVDFFGLRHLVKFYREVSLKLMGITTALAVILLATRQLPREFEQRTIYPLLARPIGRFRFLMGKTLGVWAAAAFCLGLFSMLFIGGILLLGGPLRPDLLLQHLYLQMLHTAILTAGAFLLSLLFNPDAATVLALLFYATSGLLSSAAVSLYALTGDTGRMALRLFTFALPQMFLFDLSEKAVHSEHWPSLSAGTMGQLTLYAAIYIVLFTAAAYARFRRRPL